MDKRDRKPELDKRFDQLVAGYMVGAADVPVLRMSKVVALLRDLGEERAVASVEDAYRCSGDRCPVHGHLADPIVTILWPDRIAFGCPDCSAPELKAAWEAEGEQS